MRVRKTLLGVPEQWSVVVQDLTNSVAKKGEEILLYYVWLGETE